MGHLQRTLHCMRMSNRTWRLHQRSARTARKPVTTHCELFFTAQSTSSPTPHHCQQHRLQKLQTSSRCSRRCRAWRALIAAAALTLTRTRAAARTCSRNGTAPSRRTSRPRHATRLLQFVLIMQCCCGAVCNCHHHCLRHRQLLQSVASVGLRAACTCFAQVQDATSG